MLTLEKFEELFDKYGMDYRNKEKLVRENISNCKRCLSEESYDNIYPKHFFDHEESGLEIVSFDKNKVYIFKSLDEEEFKLEIIPKSKIAFIEMNQKIKILPILNASKYISVDIYSSEKVILHLDTEEYINKYILEECNDFIEKFIRTF